MTPQIATLLVALIAVMIGVAFKFKVHRASRRWMNFDVSVPGGKRFILLTRTWR